MSVFGGFDSHALPPNLLNTLLNTFYNSRRQGTSPNTIKFYKTYLNLSRDIIGFHIIGKDITAFLRELPCSNGGKHAYHRVLRVFYNWLYSPKSGFDLNPNDNPILYVDPPKVEKKILPSLSREQVEHLIEIAPTVRDKALISLLTDSGLRLSEITRIQKSDIDFDNRLIKVICKGNKEALAPFGAKTEKFLKSWLSGYTCNGNIWGLNKNGIVDVLHRLRDKTGLPCNPHTFRRTFASLLAKRGIDSLHIMRLGRWESMAMVERYTRSVQFDDSLKLYREVVS